MSARRTSGLLLRLYPAGWRARYGEELEALILAAGDGGRVPWRVRADVAVAGARERLRAAGAAGGGAPGDRVRGGALLALWAWALFVVAGAAVQKLSEHWQAATPASDRALPSAAFAGLVVAAVAGSLLVLAGIGATIPSVAAFLRAGGWPAVRRRVLTSAALTGVAVAATAGLVAWAHGLTSPEREGRDLAYALAFAAWAVSCAACLLAWAGAAVATARRLRLPASTLRAEAWIAGAVTAAMAAMTVATGVWWAALADAAPRFLAGRPVGAAASPLAPELLAAAVAMVLATLLGAAGAWRALRAVPAL